MPYIIVRGRHDSPVMNSERALYFGKAAKKPTRNAWLSMAVDVSLDVHVDSGSTQKEYPTPAGASK